MTENGRTDTSDATLIELRSVVKTFETPAGAFTALENVVLPMDFCGMYSRRERRERAQWLLEQVEVGQHADKLPTAMSGGLQQRVAIARALANDPQILLADEPTGHLDSRTSEAVFSLFEQFVEQNKTILMVTHDMDLAARASRTIVVADGEVVDEEVVVDSA